MWGVLLGGLLSVMGGVIGALLTRQLELKRWRHEAEQEQRRWQRDARLRVYAEMSGVLDDYIQLLALVDGGADAGEEYLSAQRVRLVEQIGAISRAAGTLALVAPAPVTDLAYEIHSLAVRSFGHLRSGRHVLQTPDLAADWTLLGRRTGTFKAAARTDLSGLPVERIPDDGEFQG